MLLIKIEASVGITGFMKPVAVDEFRTKECSKSEALKKSMFVFNKKNGGIVKSILSKLEDSTINEDERIFEFKEPTVYCKVEIIELCDIELI